jgi:hypothetical protein
VQTATITPSTCLHEDKLQFCRQKKPRERRVGVFRWKNAKNYAELSIMRVYVQAAFFSDNI